MNIWIAAADNKLDLVKKYIESGIDIDSKDNNGYTALHAAVEYGHLDLIKYLVENGAQVNVTDNDLDTPLHACEQVAVAKLLVELGADLNAKNSDDLTPLEKAEAEADFPELVDFLRRKCGIEESLNLPENVHVAMVNDNLPEYQITEEQREHLAEIIQNGTDEQFQDYVQDVLGHSNSKRAHLDS